MATRQQRIQQERQRQQEEAAARRQLPDRPLGAEAIDAIEQDIAAFTQLPGVRQTLSFVGGAVNLVNEAVLEPARYAATDPSQMGSAQALAGTAILGAESLIEKSSRGGEMIAEIFNVDPRIGKVIGGGAAEELLTLGAGKVAKGVGRVVDTLPPPGAAPQLAMAGAAPIPTVQMRPVAENGVFKLTITKPERLAPGIREGIAKDPDIAKQLTRRASDILKQENRLTTWREFGGVRAAKNIKKAQADVYSKKSTMPQLVQDDPIAYRVAEYKDAAKINLEQHHLFTKAQSSAFVDRMQELIEKGIADQDDLVAMGEYAKHLGAAMGDVNSNMFNMHPKPHNIFHTQMRKAGQEVKPDVLMQQLRKAKNADELMDKFHEYIVDNVIPNKTAAKEAQAAWEIANPDIYGVQEASAMDLFIQELRKRGS